MKLKILDKEVEFNEKFELDNYLKAQKYIDSLIRKLQKRKESLEDAANKKLKLQKYKDYDYCESCGKYVKVMERVTTDVEDYEIHVPAGYENDWVKGLVRTTFRYCPYCKSGSVYKDLLKEV